MDQNFDSKYINREISWLEFNSRVLDEAADTGNPLLERLKFLAIFSSNLDEFFMVRVAAVRQLGAGAPGGQTARDTAVLLDEIGGKVRALGARQHKLLSSEILPALEKEGVSLTTYSALTPSQKTAMDKYYRSQIFPVLTPLGVDLSHPFPLIKNGGLEILVRLSREGEKNDAFAIIEVPAVIPRMLTVEKSKDRHVFMPAEELIIANLDSLLSGCVIRERSLFRITRDMDFAVDEDSIADLLSEIQIQLQKTARRQVIRLEISRDMPSRSRAWLQEQLKTPDAFVYPVSGMLDLKCLFPLSFLADFPRLRDQELPPLPSISFPKDVSVFESIRRKGSIMTHLPFESFSHVEAFVEEAATDPNVLAIKQTLYRVSGDSPILKSLIKAARNGKQVTALFELRARFDEERNIAWALELAEAGAHVVYGIAGLKVHCKALLVVRREEDGIRRYVHLSTGNYNDKTARLYTDLGFFTDDKTIASEVSALFNVITGFSRPPEWSRLLVAPFNLKDRLCFLIDREIQLATAVNPGHIIIKANSIIDFEMMDMIIKAAENNVRIDLIVRGICGVNPFINKACSKNIHIVSILDRYLEHSRIYYFRNNGFPEYYIGSADLMPRNLRRRIEVLFPIDRTELTEELDMILQTALGDKRKGRVVTGPNKYSRPANYMSFEKTRSQTKLYEFHAKRLKESRGRSKNEIGTVIFKTPPKKH